MPLLNEWLTIVVIGGLVISSPGPNFVITLRNSLVHSRQAGIYTALGLAVADMVHITCYLIGIGVLISRSVLLFNILKWMGAAYLIYVGIKSLRAKRSPQLVTPNSPTLELNPRTAFRMGFLTCLLNPKVTLFFLALFTQIIQPGTPLLTQMFYGLTIVAIEFGWAAIVALTASQPIIKNRFVAVSHWFERFTGAVLILLGLRLAVTQGDR